jgi:hypothetical protein
VGVVTEACEAVGLLLGVGVATIPVTLVVGVAAVVVGTAVVVGVGDVGAVAVAVDGIVPVRVGVGVAAGTPPMPPQNPPLSTNVPPIKVLASGWPTVPPTLKLPPLLDVAPPPSMVLRITS